jgi:hypothetical protein
MIKPGQNYALWVNQTQKDSSPLWWTTRQQGFNSDQKGQINSVTAGKRNLFLYLKHIRFQIVITLETGYQFKKRGETEKPYE